MLPFRQPAHPLTLATSPVGPQPAAGGQPGSEPTQGTVRPNLGPTWQSGSLCNRASESDVFRACASRRRRWSTSFRSSTTATTSSVAIHRHAGMIESVGAWWAAAATIVRAITALSRSSSKRTCDSELGLVLVSRCAGRSTRRALTRPLETRTSCRTQDPRRGRWPRHRRCALRGKTPPGPLSASR